MPETIIQPIEAISLSETSTATLISANDKFIKYKISYNIDPVLMAKNFSKKVKISFIEPNRATDYSAKTLPIRPSSFVDSIRLTETRAAVASTVAIELIFHTFISQLTNKFSDEVLAKINLKTKKDLNFLSSTEIENSKPKQTKRNFYALPVIANQFRQNSLPNIFEFSKAQINQTNTDSLSFAAQEILEEGIDPSEAAINLSPKLNTAYNVFQGFQNSSKLNYDYIVEKNTSVLMSALSLLEKNPNGTTIQTDEMVSQPIIDNTNLFKIEELVELETKKINFPEFYIKFELIGKENNVVQTLKFLVKHENKLSNFLIPKIPPNIKVTKSEIGNKIQLTQKDKNAISIEIYKKEIDNLQNNQKSNYQFLQSVKIKPNETKTILDKSFGDKLIIYRAISCSKNDKKSFNYSSFVLPKKKIQKNRFVSAMYEILSSNSISINLNYIPSSVIAIQIYRQILSSKQNREKFKTPISINQENFITFIDNSLEKGKIYSYTFELIYRNGITQFSTTELQFEFLPKQIETIKTVISNVLTTKNFDKFDVEFNLSSDFTESEADLLRNSLTEAGVIQFFSDSINKETLQTLTAYEIIRKNITTNQVEYLGITTKKNFKDSISSKISGASSLVSGNRYEYTVNTLLRRPELSVVDYVATVEDKLYPSKTFTYNPWLARHPVRLTEGNIVSERTLKANHAKNLFSFGEIGDITKLSIHLEDSYPIINNNIEVIEIENGFKIKWQISGNVEKIEHFLIGIELIGIRTLIDRVHTFSNSNTFEYVFVNTNHYANTIKFIIIPVYYDYNIGPIKFTDRYLIQ